MHSLALMQNSEFCIGVNMNDFDCDVTLNVRQDVS